MNYYEMTHYDELVAKYKELEKIVDTYNDCIFKLESKGINVGNEYSGYMSLDYNRSERCFYISVEY